MTDRKTLKQSLYVRASMFTADELRRQKRFGLNQINEELLSGLVEQRRQLEIKQETLIRSLYISLFISFVAWRGESVTIPGTGALVSEVPAILELALISAAFGVLFASYSFLSIQLYNSLISAIASVVLAKSKLDPDIFAAAQTPTWLFAKYAQRAPVNGREPGFKISRLGNIYNSILTGFISIIILAAWLFSVFSIAYLAHTGLSNSWTGWSVYILCIVIILAAIFSMAANFLEFEHEMDFDILEKIEQEP